MPKSPARGPAFSVCGGWANRDFSCAKKKIRRTYLLVEPLTHCIRTSDYTKRGDQQTLSRPLARSHKYHLDKQNLVRPMCHPDQTLQPTDTGNTHRHDTSREARPEFIRHFQTSNVAQEQHNQGSIGSNAHSEKLLQQEKYAGHNELPEEYTPLPAQTAQP